MVNSLKSDSIQTFIDLANSFIGWLVANVLAERKTSYLKTVRQRTNESLREYVPRFNVEAL